MPKKHDILTKLPNGTPIYYWQYWTIYNATDREHGEVGRMFYRAWIKKAKKPYNWIMKGRKTYARQLCSDEYNCPKTVQAWIDTVIGKQEPEKPTKRNEIPESMASILGDFYK